jgi:MFS transporter, ACS family, DAL5 transporter family protein
MFGAVICLLLSQISGIGAILCWMYVATPLRLLIILTHHTDVLFEIPANIALKRTSPTVWLPSLTLVWGIVSVCQGLVHNRAGFYAVRFVLGATEAGLFPGVTYVFSMYYTREQRSVRVAFFFSGAAMAGAFGGILAYGLGLIHGGGRPGWAWIFIVEGLLTIVASFIAYFIVPTWPQTAAFLTDSERARLLSRLRRDADSADSEPFNWRGVRQALSDPLAYLYGLLFHGSAFALYSISLFLPTIIKNLGFATWKVMTLSRHLVNYRSDSKIITGAGAFSRYNVSELMGPADSS